MAVSLEKLYTKLHPKYGVKLRTESCFGKSITWFHILEDIEFVSLLRGGELILNSEYESDEWLKKYIELLNQANAGGLIIALRPGQTFTQEIIDYCNKIRFPLFSATWNTSYMDIMHFFSSILLKNEHKEADRITALKNAIHYPDKAELYQSYFEEAELGEDKNYVIIMVGYFSNNAENDNTQIEQIGKSLRYSVSGSVVYEENGVLTVLVSGYQKAEIVQQFKQIYEKNDNMRIGVGFLVHRICDIHRSYEAAGTAYQLTKTGLHKNFLDYDDLGVYKILSDVKNATVYPAFVEETLGPLLKYDEENRTDYVQILETYFANECNGINTASVLYFHKNTMTFKLNKIKEILGYDILKNENRTKIMLTFYIMQLGKGYFSE